LSYTSFEYSGLELPDTVKAGEDFKVLVNVKNIGDAAGKEVVQLYVRDVESSLARPVKELKGFVKVDLNAGESKIVAFNLDPRALSYYDPHQQAWVEEAGTFEVMIGASSRDIRLKETFELRP
jgi:beta-glucosidase